MGDSQNHDDDLPRSPTATVIGNGADHVAHVIGPYKLMEQIGEGGFGLVFVAKQQKPVRRRVAIKVIKPGMDTHEVITRFEAEQQALALMDHPNIARVLDAGTTNSGRPYFVMELVHGMPVTGCCDQAQAGWPTNISNFFVSVLPSSPARPPERHYSPRHQALERARHPARRPPRWSTYRLRRCQSTCTSR